MEIFDFYEFLKRNSLIVIQVFIISCLTRLNLWSKYTRQTDIHHTYIDIDSKDRETERRQRAGRREIRRQISNHTMHAYACRCSLVIEPVRRRKQNHLSRFYRHTFNWTDSMANSRICMVAPAAYQNGPLMPYWKKSSIDLFEPPVDVEHKVRYYWQSHVCLLVRWKTFLSYLPV